MWTQNSLEASATGHNNCLCGKGGQTLEEDIPVTYRAWSFKVSKCYCEHFCTCRWNKLEETSSVCRWRWQRSRGWGRALFLHTDRGSHSCHITEEQEGIVCTCWRLRSLGNPGVYFRRWEGRQAEGGGCPSEPCCPVSSPLWPVRPGEPEHPCPLTESVLNSESRCRRWAEGRSGPERPLGHNLILLSRNVCVLFLTYLEARAPGSRL